MKLRTIKFQLKSTQQAPNMLEKLLVEIKSGSTSSIEELALKLSTTPAMIRAMLAHLENANLIKRYLPCQSSCSGCAMKNLCAVDQSQRSPDLYIVEDKNE